MALTLVTSDLIGGLDYSKLTGTVPTWNQNTSGTAAGLSATLVVGSGGTGVTSITALKNVLDDETWTFANATTFSGIVGIGSTGIFAGSAAILNLQGIGIALKNDKNGSNNNWSYIQNTGTGSSSDINFYTGNNSSALNLSHSGDATFSGDIIPKGNTRNISFQGTSVTNINAQIQYDQVNDTTGQLFFKTANSGTLATRLTISSGGVATFSTGANRNLLIDRDSVDTGYNIVSLNGTNVKGSYSGIAGGHSADDNLYLNSPNNVVVQTGSGFAARLTITSGGDATFSGNVSLADTKYIQLNNTSTDWRLRADNAGRFVVQTTSGSEQFKVGASSLIEVGSGTGNNTFLVTKSSAGWYSGIKLTRGLGDGSSTGNNNFGMLVTDNGWEVATFTSPSNNVTGRSTKLLISSGGDATFSGDVSVGTTSTASKLNVLGTSTAPSNTISDAIVDIRGTSTAHLLMGVASVSPYGAWINTDSTSQPLVLMGTGGNVGIGTTLPTTALTIKKAISSSAYGSSASMIEFKSYFPGYDTETVKSAIYSGVSGLGTLNTQGGFLAFHVNNNGTMGEKLRIEKTGNVGIGTTSPARKLTVMEQGLFTNSGTDGGLSYVGAAPILTVSTDGNGNASGNYLNNAVFLVGIGGGNSTSVTTTHFRINLSGDVGIGTTSPLGKLHIVSSGGTDGLRVNAGTSSSNNAFVINNEADNATLFYIRGNGDSSFGGGNLTANNKFAQNSVGRRCNSGYTAGNASFYVDYTVTNMSSLKVTAVFNHYGYITSYGCARFSLVGLGPVITVVDISTTTSGNGGSWSLSRIDNTTLRVSKNAGTYSGGGYYFIEVIGAQVS